MISIMDLCLLCCDSLFLVERFSKSRNIVVASSSNQTFPEYNHLFTTARHCFPRHHTNPLRQTHFSWCTYKERKVTITVYFQTELKTTPTCVCLTVCTGDSIQLSSCVIYGHSATFVFIGVGLCWVDIEVWLEVYNFARSRQTITVVTIYSAAFERVQ